MSGFRRNHRLEILQLNWGIVLIAQIANFSKVQNKKASDTLDTLFPKCILSNLMSRSSGPNLICYPVDTVCWIGHMVKAFQT